MGDAVEITLSKSYSPPYTAAFDVTSDSDLRAAALSRANTDYPDRFPA